MRKRPKQTSLPDTLGDTRSAQSLHRRYWERPSNALESVASQNILPSVLPVQGHLYEPQTLLDDRQYVSQAEEEEPSPSNQLRIPYTSIADLQETANAVPHQSSQDILAHSDQISHSVLEGQRKSTDGRNTESVTFIGRAHYIHENSPIDERSARSYPTSKANELSEVGATVLELFKSFDLPPRSTRQSLVDNFIQYCHPWTPILSRSELETSETRRPSLLLMQALLVAASKVSSSPAIPAFATPEEFYQRAKALFYMNYESDPITVIKSTIMLQWYTPDGPEHVSYDAGEFWLKLGVGIAFQVGLHREPSPGPTSSIRRRMWWSLVVRIQIPSNTKRTRS